MVIKYTQKYERKEAEKMTNMIYTNNNLKNIIFVHASGLVLK